MLIKYIIHYNLQKNFTTRTSEGRGHYAMTM